MLNTLGSNQTIVGSQSKSSTNQLGQPIRIEHERNFVSQKGSSNTSPESSKLGITSPESSRLGLKTLPGSRLLSARYSLCEYKGFSTLPPTHLVSPIYHYSPLSRSLNQTNLTTCHQHICLGTDQMSWTDLKNHRADLELWEIEMIDLSNILDRLWRSTDKGRGRNFKTSDFTRKIICSPDCVT